jgi:hypothetical protein
MAEDETSSDATPKTRQVRRLSSAQSKRFPVPPLKPLYVLFKPDSRRPIDSPVLRRAIAARMDFIKKQRGLYTVGR